jgi:HEAT repeat protein
VPAASRGSCKLSAGVAICPIKIELNHLLELDMLDQAFDALKTYNWGADVNALKPIDDATIKSRDNEAERKALEARLAAVLGTDASRDAKDYVCRKLMLIGTPASVPALAALLSDADNSHMARYALERIPAAEAAQALRDALPKLNPALKVGAIGSLGVRRDADSIPALTSLLGDSDAGVVCAAACALGDIGTPAGAKALTDAKPTDKTKQAVIDARLVCAEGLLAGGQKVEALAIYKSLVGDDQAKHVRLAATRGMLACAGK